MAAHSQRLRALQRSWSFLLLVVLYGLMLAGWLTSEPARAAVAAVSILLVVQCWRAQRPYVESRSRLVLLSLILSLPAFASAWLGLNVIRFYTYPGDAESGTYYGVVRLQHFIATSSIVIAIIALQWSIAELASILGETVSRRLVGKRQTWWNRPLRPRWLWGGLMGYVISLLIVSSFLRWAFVAFASLGILFAVLFRALRPKDEI